MSITIPNTFTPGEQERSAELNANFGVVRDEVNSHQAALNPHQTKLSDILALNNSAGTYSINFNGNQALTFVIENLASDPTPSRRGRMFLNTTDGNLKFDTGSTIVTIAGAGVNNLTSVLNAGNSAGSSNLDLNQNQLLHMRIENVASDPTPGNIGRLVYNTTTAALKLDTGSSLVAVGGSQGLASVLGISNSTGTNDLDFNLHQAKNMAWEALASDPGVGTTGRVYFNTTSGKPRFYNGSAWVDVGNTNTLAQVLALGNSVGASAIDFNNKQALHLVLWNNAGSPGTGTAGLVWYDTGTSQINYETGTSNHAVCSLDQAQTLTNKTISGGSNTLTNVQDGSLSSNVTLLNANQTVTGTKTFSASPVLSSVKTPAGSVHTITDGLANDTVTLNNAVQELRGKTLNAPTLSGNLDFANYQAVRARIENVSATPAPGQPGRIVFKTTTGELLWDNGTTWTVVGSATSLFPTLAQVLSTGNTAGANSVDFNENQALRMRVENLGADPAAANAGRLFYNTGSTNLRYDTGAAIKEVVNLDSAQALSNKNLVANSTKIQNAFDPTISFQFDPGGTTGTYTVLQTSQTANQLIALPDASDTLVGQATTDTLTNKTMDGGSNTFTNLPNSATTATSANTASTIVARNASGNFTAGTITASLTGNVTGNLTGNASGSAASFTGSLAGDVTGNQGTTVVATVGTSTAANVHSAEVAANAATNLNTASALVKRDASGNFSAGTITANLTGNASGTAASITGNLTGDVTSVGMATTIGAGKVTNGMLAGSIASSKLVGSDIATVGTITSGTWNGTAIDIAHGGTNATTGPTAFANLAPTPSTSGNVLTSNGTSWVSSTPAASPTAPGEMYNLGLATSVATNAMTVALKQSDGTTDPATGAGAVKISFRNATAATGGYVERSVTAALSVVISSGASLGLVSAQNQYVWVYALDNAGTVELAVAGQRIFDDGSVQSTTAMSGTATSNTVLYSTTARTNVPIRLIGRLKTNETTAGTWASNATEIAMAATMKVLMPSSEIVVNAGNGHGSTNTMVRRFSTTESSTGSAITYADSATAGGSFTINEDGIYSMCYQDFGAATVTVGISRNSAQLTTIINSITAANRLVYGAAESGNVANAEVTRVLRAGDVIRAHDDGTPNGTGAQIKFSITQIAKL